MYVSVWVCLYMCVCLYVCMCVCVCVCVAREASMWDTEEKYLIESSALTKRQLQQMFELVKQQLSHRHTQVRTWLHAGIHRVIHRYVHGPIQVHLVKQQLSHRHTQVCTIIVHGHVYDHVRHSHTQVHTRSYTCTHKVLHRYTQGPTQVHTRSYTGTHKVLHRYILLNNSLTRCT